MQIKSLDVRSFKSLKDLTLALEPYVTVLAGANRSGKTNVLDSMLAYRDCLGAIEFDPSSGFRSRGGWHEVTFGKRPTPAVSICVGYSLSEEEAAAVFGIVSDAAVSLTIRARGEGNVDYNVHCEIPGRDPVDIPIAYFSTNLSRRDIAVDFKWLTQHAERIYNLDAARHLGEPRPAVGDEILASSGENAIAVLSGLVQKDIETYQRFVKTASDVLPGVQKIRTPIAAGASSPEGSIQEREFPTVPFSERQWSKGTEQAVIMLTLLFSSPPDSLLVIEEPEDGLHVDAVLRLLEVFDVVAREERKQIVITTHSAAVIEWAGAQRLRICVRDAETGETSVRDLSQFDGAAKLLRKQGVSIYPFLSERLAEVFPLPKVLVVVEGQDDVAVFRQFLNTISAEGIRLISAERGGDSMVKLGDYLTAARACGQHSIAFVLIRDSDGQLAERSNEFREAGFDATEYHVLERNEIEDYLLDPGAIAGVTGKALDEASRAIELTKGSGKEKLSKVLRSLGVEKCDTGTKELLAARLDPLPKEIQQILEQIVLAAA